MADVITRFKLETTQFDSKLRDTSKALRDIAHQAELGGKDFDKFSDEAIKSARTLGTVQSGATNTKDKLRDLVGSYNDAAKAYNSLTETAKKGEFGQAMSQSLTQLQQRIKETKEELYGLGDGMKGASGGGLFSGDKLSGMLQVFGGNLMTKGAGMVMSFAGEMKDMVAQGIELARAGEGIRIAFQRLGRGDILDGLREATHGTVTDLELMKAAVKFNDFKLPLDELGTMLAFAQQKAKDTGQSVDYMVDSIVTGLGRKSLMILDNLGLSATEIRDKMKETGDMTKAVGAIIREQMQKAGDYVETAADRATQANVAMQNKMEELGQKFLPVKQASDDLWTSMKIGILDIVGGPLANLLNGLTRAGQLRNQLKAIGSEERVNTDIEKLKGSNYKPQAYQMMLAKYSREEQKALDNYKRSQKGGMGSIAVWENRYLAQKSMREDFQARGSAIVNPTPTATTPVPVEIKNPTGGGGGNSIANIGKFVPEEGVKNAPPEFKPMWDTAIFQEALRKELGLDGEQTRDWGKELGKVLPDYVADPDKEKRDKANKDDKETKKLTEKISTLTSGLSSIASGLKSMGIDLPKEVDQVIGIIQGVTSVIEGVNSVISIFSTSAMAANTAAIVANTAALIANSTTNLIPLAGGGIVPHAAGGYLIGGNNYSGDNIFAGHAWVNSGELVLNRAQQGNLASQLQGGTGAMQLSAIITGEQLRLVLNNNGRRTGRGEYVTTNFR